MTLVDRLSYPGHHSGACLALALNTDKRNIRSMVLALRREGYPILSGDDGYWLSNDEAEIKRCASRLIAHGSQECKIAWKMLKGARLKADPVQEAMQI